MFSPFLKKLLFARKFSIGDGEINLINQHHVLLPLDILLTLDKKQQKTIRDVFKKYTKGLEPLLKPSQLGYFDSMIQIIGCFGIGKPNITALDNNKKKAIIRITHPHFSNASNHAMFLEAMLGGIFSTYFKKEVQCKAIACNIKDSYCELKIE